MGKGGWIGLLSALVPIFIVLATLFGRNTTLLNEHDIRISNIEESHAIVVQEFLKAGESRKRISDRVAYLEGRLSPSPTVATDERGHR